MNVYLHESKAIQEQQQWRSAHATKSTIFLE